MVLGQFRCCKRQGRNPVPEHGDCIALHGSFQRATNRFAALKKYYRVPAVDIHGYPCISMDIHGYPKCQWISMDIHGRSMEIDINGHQWMSHGTGLWPVWVPLDLVLGSLLRHTGDIVGPCPMLGSLW